MDDTNVDADVRLRQNCCQIRPSSILTSNTDPLWNRGLDNLTSTHFPLTSDSEIAIAANKQAEPIIKFNAYDGSAIQPGPFSLNESQTNCAHVHVHRTPHRFSGSNFKEGGPQTVCKRELASRPVSQMDHTTEFETLRDQCDSPKNGGVVSCVLCQDDLQ